MLYLKYNTNLYRYESQHDRHFPDEGSILKKCEIRFTAAFLSQLNIFIYPFQ